MILILKTTQIYTTYMYKSPYQPA